MRLFTGIVFCLMAATAQAKVNVEYVGFKDGVATTTTFHDGKLQSVVDVMTTQDTIYTTYYYKDGIDCKPGDAFSDTARYNGQSVAVTGFCTFNDELESTILVFRPKTKSGLKYVTGQFRTSKLVTIELLGWFTGIKTDGFNDTREI